MKEYH